jgi:hypothetical protein
VRATARVGECLCFSGAIYHPDASVVLAANHAADRGLDACFSQQPDALRKVARQAVLI